MNAEKILAWAQNELLRAMADGHTGSVTFKFNDGWLVCGEKLSKFKPSEDKAT